MRKIGKTLTGEITQEELKAALGITKGNIFNIIPVSEGNQFWNVYVDVFEEEGFKLPDIQEPPVRQVAQPQAPVQQVRQIPKAPQAPIQRQQPPKLAEVEEEDEPEDDDEF